MVTYKKQISLRSAIIVLEKMRSETCDSFYNWRTSLEESANPFPVDIVEELMREDLEKIHSLNAVIGYVEKFLETLDSDGTGFVVSSCFGVEEMN